MLKEVIVRLHKNFEDFVHEDQGVEYWLARELQGLLGYNRWENFENALKKAKIACVNAAQVVEDHFRDITKMVDLGSGSQREVADTKLTRYACYLIAQNGDPHKDEIAFAMTYFAVQTRKQELVEQRLAERERIHAREKLSLSEKNLSGILFERGIDGAGFARIRSRGDAAMFGGHDTSDMKRRLGVKDSRPLADFLPSITIKAKDLANEITSHNVKRDSALEGEVPISAEHVKSNEHVRETLVKSGIYPELLPVGEDIKKIERKLQTENKKLAKDIPKLKT